jgi:hypothetical protein
MKKLSLQFAAKEPGVEILIACIVTAHIDKFCGILRVLEKFSPARAARVIVVQIQAHHCKARIVDVGLGPPPQVRAVEYQHRANRLAWFIFGQVG